MRQNKFQIFQSFEERGQKSFEKISFFDILRENLQKNFETENGTFRFKIFGLKICTKNS